MELPSFFSVTSQRTPLSLSGQSARFWMRSSSVLGIHAGKLPSRRPNLTASALVLLLVFAFPAHLLLLFYQQLSLLSNAPHQSSARTVGNPFPVGGFFLHWQVSITTWHVSSSSSNRQ